MKVPALTVSEGFVGLVTVFNVMLALDPQINRVMAKLNICRN